MSKHQLAVSYSWEVEKNGPYKGQVRQFCDTLKEKGLTILRDCDDIGSGESINEFMTEVGKHTTICVFLSPEYLKSEYCMYELCLAWQRGTGATNEIREQLKVYQLASIGDLSQIDERDQHANYWAERLKKIDDLLDEKGTTNIAKADIEKRDMVRYFSNNIRDILAFVSDNLNSQNLGDFQNRILSDFNIGYTTHSSDDIRKTFGEVYDRFEEILHQDSELKKLLLAKYEIDNSLSENEVADRLIERFYANYNGALGIFFNLQLQHQMDDDKVLKLIATTLYLSMSCNFAKTTAEENDSNILTVPSKVTDSIIQMIIAWNKHQGKEPIDFQGNHRAERVAAVKAHPVAQRDEFKKEVYSSIHGDKSPEDIDTEIAADLELFKDAGYPKTFLLKAVGDDDRDTFQEIIRSEIFKNAIFAIQDADKVINESKPSDYGPKIGAKVETIQGTSHKR